MTPEKQIEEAKYILGPWWSEDGLVASIKLLMTESTLAEMALRQIRDLDPSEGFDYRAWEIAQCACCDQIIENHAEDLGVQHAVFPYFQSEENLS